MTLSTRDKRLVVFLIPALAFLVWKVTSSDGPATPVATASDSVPLAERRLAKLRQMYATVPGKEELYKKASEELAVREKGMIVADTAQQAQAKVQQILRKIGGAQGIEVRGAEFGQVKPLGPDYGEAPVSVSFDCAIEQFVNFLSDLANQPEMLGTTDIRVAAGNPKDKRIGVRLTVAGLVAKKLIPEKKGVTSF